MVRPALPSGREVTREPPFTAFVLYSPVAGSLETPGQGNYSAANTVLVSTETRWNA
ncbi:KR domain-containing protein [Nocardia colli]|uniref:KR domain-containing protein n=1 Tax=Nocardia colli TaxID=2545717 RepID=UPI0035D7A9C3